MDSNRLKGNWKDLKGKAKEQWGKLTNDDIDVVDGRTDQLVGAIQKRYGRSKDEAEREVNEWQNKMSD